MVYDIIGSGGVVGSSCANYTHAHYIVTAYGPGDILYNVNKARKGVLEKVVIKKPQVTQSAKTYGLAIAIYIDTLNAMWNEDDLVPYTSAITFATDYYQSQLDTLDALSC